MRELEPQEFVVRRSDLVAYADASGDQNPIHQDEAIAQLVGLPGVIAHGMYTMALAARAVATWTGDAEVVEIGCKFTAPVVVPADGGATVRIAGVVKSVAEGLRDHRARRHLLRRQGARRTEGCRPCRLAVRPARRPHHAPARRPRPHLGARDHRGGADRGGLRGRRRG